MARATGFALALAVLAHSPLALQPREVTLTALTMGNGLPPDCTLISSAREPLTVGLTVPDVRVPSNPWSGSDRAIVAAVRETVYGGPKLPDAPLMTMSALRQFLLHLADGVSEAYVAAYEQKGFGRVSVYGLRFSAGTAVPSLPAPAVKTRVRSQVQAGQVVAAVDGRGECVDVLSSHMTAVLVDTHR